MHVLPAKHSFARLPRKCDYKTGRQTHGQTDGQTDAGQSDPYVPLCFAGDTKLMIIAIVKILVSNVHKLELSYLDNLT